MSQLMVAAAAREISDGSTVFVGMRLPLLGFLLAKSLHAPDAVGVYELGIVRDHAAPESILTMGDLPNLYKACWLADTRDAMAILQKGMVDISFIGGAQIDQYGNLNTSYVGQAGKNAVRLPGSGGACDLACLAKQHIIIMKHERRRFVPRVDYITSPGYGDGYQWRRNNELPGNGPSTVITTLGVLGFNDTTRKMTLMSVHPGIDVETVLLNTGWDLEVSSALKQTPAPSKRELDILNFFDPRGYWTGA